MITSINGLIFGSSPTQLEKRGRGFKDSRVQGFKGLFSDSLILTICILSSSSILAEMLATAFIGGNTKQNLFFFEEYVWYSSS
jgi:hypothetical protein